MRDYKVELDEYQMAAVEAMGNVLVVAGPGAGKTQVLVQRICNLIQKHSVPPEKILALTFTRKAAQEMKNRIKAVTHSEVNATTFHSFCLNEMRKYPALFDIRQNVDILDDEDRLDLISAILTQGAEAVIKTTGFKPEYFLSKCFSKSKNKLIDIRETVREALSDEDGIALVSENFMLEIQDVVEKMYEQYEEKKSRYNKMDYDDILYYYYLGLTRNQEYVNYTGEGLYMLVDEYQDTNAVQLDIIKKLGSVNNQVFAVGDDMQAIYLFRDADIYIMRRFQEEICEGRPPLFLRYNYRSKQNIVEHINKYMENIQTAIYDRVLIPSCYEHGILIDRVFENNYEQARAVAGIIQRKIKEGTRPEEIAVLYRADFLSYPVEIELNKAGIEYNKIGGISFFERAHIKDLLATLLLIMDSTDVTSLFRVIVNIAKINRTTARKIIDDIDKGDFDIFNSNQIFTKYNKVADKLLRIKKLVEECKQDINDRPASSFLELVSNYIKNIYRLHKSDEELLSVHRDYEMLRRMSDKYRDIRSFLNSLLAQKAERSYEDKRNDNVVTLSTIHGVKGEEYDVVIIINTGYVSKKSMNSRKFLSEEERIYYVAITRARNELYKFYVGNDNRDILPIFKFKEYAPADPLDVEY